MKHNHAEAFKLMIYACENPDCLHQEKIWNSRDGVTPFGKPALDARELVDI